MTGEPHKPSWEPEENINPALMATWTGPSLRATYAIGEAELVANIDDAKEGKRSNVNGEMINVAVPKL